MRRWMIFRVHPKRENLRILRFQKKCWRLDGRGYMLRDDEVTDICVLSIVGCYLKGFYDLSLALWENDFGLWF